MPLLTIEWVDGGVRIIDQRKLPRKLVYLNIKSATSMWQAIKKLKVRGAPVIGVAGAFGVLLGIRNTKTRNYREFKKRLDEVINYLASSRPTAVNLFWALRRLKIRAEENKDKGVDRIKDILLKEAFKIMEEDKKVCRRMAVFGSKLIKSGDRILTHCNAGGLATVDYGTALGVLFKAKKDGKKIKVFVDETRPLLQGARLTTWELLREKIDVTLICDNMAASLMKKGKIDKIFVGADRIARNGDVANKIGTYNLAVLADFHKVPFYAVAPLSTFDFNLSSGNDIPIEERNGNEIREMGGTKIAPANVKVYNPAFDVTPACFVRAIVTEIGILRPPYSRTLKRISYKPIRQARGSSRAKGVGG